MGGLAPPSKNRLKSTCRPTVAKSYFEAIECIFRELPET